MRAEGIHNAIRLKAYAGTTGVMLAMNVTNARRTGLLGFAIEREGPAGEHRWLQGLLRFPGQGGARLSPVASAKAPIQKFRWTDYSVYPDSAYRYRVHGVYGSPQALKRVRGGEVSLKTEPLDGLHQVIFNRAAAASQAYARRFGNANPDAPGNDEARRWLSRGLREKLIAFIERAQGPDWTIDVAIYEIELPEVVDSLESAMRRGAGVRVVYHAKAGDPQTAENERYLARLPVPLKKARVTSSIFHQKFMVLSRVAADGRRQPAAVLTGSTNFTSNGVYRQANVVHIVEDPALAEDYLGLFEHLFSGEAPRATKRYIDQTNPIGSGAREVAFSPRSGLSDIAAVTAAMRQAESDVTFCTAFDLHPDVMAALVPKVPDAVIRYGLQNSRSQITGVHRFGTFVASAYLKEGLEGFLQESTAGQKGRILIHLKAIVCDFTGPLPVIITGSNNFSNASSAKNDENMLVLKGQTSAADTYVCEMMRLYDHYRFRFNQQSPAGRGPTKRLQLSPDDSWTGRYFETGNLLALERARFCPMK
ncbi:MAG TPA: phospholipase D-like domain-containing protein [Desulfobacterales bacterium]|nr:phospholipase D-like domain-containing protein [Desulfobacterales bacterium]